MSSKLYCKQIKILFMCISLRNKIIIGDWILFIIIISLLR